MMRTDLGPTEYQWGNVTKDAAFGGRDGVGALVFRDRMFLLGGWNPRDPDYHPRHCVNDVWCSEDGVHWQLEKENSFVSFPFFELGKDWEGTHTAGYVVYDDKMWIMGGSVSEGEPGASENATIKSVELANSLTCRASITSPARRPRSASLPRALRSHVCPWLAPTSTTWCGSSSVRLRI